MAFALVAETLVDLLRQRSRLHPSKLLYAFVSGGTNIDASVTYAELDERARAVAVRLREQASEGDRALLLYPPGIDFIVAFFACLYAGLIPVPAYPPDIARLGRSLPRLRAMVEDAGADLALTVTQLLAMSDFVFAEAPDLRKLRWLSTDDVPKTLAEAWTPPTLDRDSIAFLQYTSGSTSTPKGVMVTHANILENEAVIAQGFGHGDDVVIAGWLPVYHDMGLIGNVLQPLFIGGSAYLMSPIEFLQRPLTWLQCVSHFRATTSGGPNFAYDLCARKVSHDQVAALDLSHWRVAFNGAEPIRPDTLARFADKFATAGFQRQAFYPCYGLAEGTLFVTGERVGHGAGLLDVDGDALDSGAFRAPTSDTRRATTLVSCGGVYGNDRVCIVDPTTRVPRPEGSVGEIWVQGASVAKGYWRRPDATAETFGATLADVGPSSEGRDADDGTFLRTGDLGFVRGASLYITGRAKDLIILNGRNLYPQDLERTAERADRRLRPGCAAAFGVDVSGIERVVLAIEVERTFDPASADEISGCVRASVAMEHEIELHAVVLLKAGSIPKTSSGKIQRRACKAGFLDGSLELVGSSIARETTDVSPSCAIDRAGALALEGDARVRALVEHIALRSAQTGLPVRLSDAGRSFAEQGIDSIRALELKAVLEDDFQIDVPLAKLFGGASPRDIAVHLAERLAAAVHATAAPASEVEDGCALSAGQRALWFLHRLDPNSAAYHVTACLRLLSRPDDAALERAVDALLTRHPQLASVFPTQERAVVRATREGVFTLHDVVGLDAHRLRERVAAAAHEPFDLRHGPVFRVHRFRGSEGGELLLLVVHHIAVDFWSLETVARDLGELYDRELGRGAPMAPAPKSFVELAKQANRWLDSDAARAEIAFWREQLRDVDTSLDLPIDFRRRATQTYEGDSLAFEVSTPLAGKILDCARTRKVTPYVVLLTAYQVLLGRLSGQSDILVGTPVAGRPNAAARDVVGYFVNPVVVRARLGGDPTVGALLDATKQTVVRALEHSQLPFSTLVERLQPPREPNRTPLFQTMFALQSARSGDHGDLALLSLGESLGSARLGSLDVAGYAVPHRMAQFDLAMTLAQSGAAFAGSLEFNTDLFTPATAARIVDQYLTVLAQLVSGADLRLSEVTLGSGVEILPTEREAPRAGTLWTLLREAFESYSDLPAIVAGPISWTYRALAERANSVEAELLRAGVSRGDVVALCMPRCPEAIAAIVGALQAGAAYLPIDPGQPIARIAQLIQDAGARVVLTHDAVVAGIPADLTRIDCAQLRATPSSAVGPRQPPVASDVAYVIYTSGTTGLPKGVEVEHASAAAYVRYARDAFGLGPGERSLQLASFAFDLSVEEIFMVLTSGATLVLRDDELMRSPTHFLRRCGELGITTLDLPTAYFHELVASATADDWRLAERVKTVIVGGERALVERVVRFRELVGDHVRLFNTYGPTEATVVATTCELTAFSSEALAAMRELPIGLPIPCARAFVVTPGGKLAASGEPGELYLGGVTLARGYRHAPDLTAAKFVTRDFAPGVRLYRTGDRVRQRHDGALEYLGRLDHQVKVRGFRVELGEIESVLATLPGVAHAVVVNEAGPDGHQRLLAYVEPTADAKGDDGLLATLRATLKDRLPQYMVPSSFTRVSAMPWLASGKVNRRALPAPGLEIVGDHVEAATVTEGLVTDVWKRVLSVPQVSVTANFFDVGGHSLLLPKVADELERAGHSSLPLVKLLEHPTIRTLAAHLDGRAAGLGSEAPSRASAAADRAQRMKAAMAAQTKSKRGGSAR